MKKIFNQLANQNSYPFSLPVLPYDKTSFGKLLSAESFDYHYSKHHNAYVVNGNKLLENDNKLHNKSLETLITELANDDTKQSIFNNLAQIWNHSFFWHSITPNQSQKEPSGKLLDQINIDFGDLENFKTQFKQTGATQFGSGWVWLVLDNKKLKIIKTANADSPITQNYHPIITCDVWEHAYYIDYRNARPDFLAQFIDNLVNWEFAEKNFTEAF